MLERIGQRYGIPLTQPLSERHLCLAVVLYAQTHKPTTIRLFVSAVADWTRHKWGTELPRGRLYDTVLASLFNLYGNSNVSTPKTAVTAEDLDALYTLLDLRYFEHARDWSAYLLAFYGLLRIGEYMDGGLRIGHVTPTASGLDITIQFNKTSKAPTTISVAARSDNRCPLRAFTHYRAFLTTLRPTTAHIRS